LVQLVVSLIKAQAALTPELVLAQSLAALFPSVPERAALPTNIAAALVSMALY
jgi:hypothetical protein